MKPADILIVDDNTANLQMLSQLLKENGHRVRPVSSGQQALQILESFPSDLVLLDVKMPDMNGYTVCEHIKAKPANENLPVIFISAADDLDAKIEGFEVGGVDYITKPFEEREVLSRVSTHLRMHYLQQQLNEKVQQLEQANQRIFELSIRDELTQLYNRRYFNEQVARLVADTKRYGRTFSVMVGDIDYFKRINDTYSHVIGDEVLRVIGILLQENTRTNDLVARYGGEEFVAGFPETTLAQAVQICEKLREKIEDYPWHTISPGLSVTMSMGVANNSDAHTYESVIADADLKLYEAKDSGRNQVRY